MGALEEQFERLRDTRANIREEILSILFCSDKPLGVQSIRLVMKDRHLWSISVKTVVKFVNELVSEGSVEHVGDTIWTDPTANLYTLSEGAMDVRRRGRAKNVVYRCRPIQG